MSTEEKKETGDVSENNDLKKEEVREKGFEPMKEEKPERNNSKRTGMPFGFDELFFKFDHHFVE